MKRRDFLAAIPAVMLMPAAVVARAPRMADVLTHRGFRVEWKQYPQKPGDGSLGAWFGWRYDHDPLACITAIRRSNQPSITEPQRAEALAMVIADIDRKLDA